MMLSRRAALGATMLLAMGTARRAAWADAALVPVTIAVSSTSLAYGGLQIAEKAGLFEKNGIGPKIIVMDSGNAAMTAVLGGSADFSSAGPGEVLAARVRGQKMVIVANVYRGLSGSLVLAKSAADKLGGADAAIEQKLKALNGLTIATPSATSAYTHPYKSAAEALRAQPHFVYMAQPAMVTALQAGAIQGLIAGAPFSTAAVASGAGVLWISGPKGELPAADQPASSACLQTSEAYAAKHPDIVAKLQATFASLAGFMRQDPDKAQHFLADAYPQLDAATIKTVFKDDGPNWTRPIMTEDDIRREIAIQASSGSLQGVEAIQPGSILLMPQ